MRKKTDAIGCACAFVALEVKCRGTGRFVSVQKDTVLDEDKYTHTVVLL